MGRRQTAQLLTIVLATLLVPLDFAVNIAFPEITRHFGAPLESIRWIVVPYVSAYAGCMLVFGRVGDLFGHARVFAAGLILSIVAFTACAAAVSFEGLVAARLLQGVAASMVLSCGPALITALADEDHRARMLGAYTLVFGIGGAAGPLVGGALVDAVGWPGVFWFRIPIAAAALALLWLAGAPQQTRARGRLDIILTAGGLVTVMALFAACALMDRIFTEPAYIGVPALIAVAAALVVRWRQTSTSDVVPRLSASLIAVNSTNIAANLTGFAFMLFLPHFLTGVTSMTSAQAGMVMGIGTLGMMLAAYAGARLSGHVGSRKLALIAALLIAGGTGAAGFWNSATPIAVILLALMLHGAGVGLYQFAALDVTTHAMARTDRGVAGSIVMVTRTIGVVLAASLLTAMLAALDTSGGVRHEAGWLSAYQTTFLVAASGLAIWTAVAVAVTPRSWFGR